MTQPIVEQVDKSILISELTPDIFIRPTNNIGNHIYIFNGNNKPNLLREVGRLREISFRQAGGGTGKSFDLDEFDTGKHAYNQLIVWNPIDEEIVGGYRFILCKDARDDNGDYHLSTTEIFTFSENLKTNYFPLTIELGRSFVQPNYQPSAESRKGLYSLDNLWDGLGALVIDNPSMKYFFGKITMYTDFNEEARDLILAFMETMFPNDEILAAPQNPIHRKYDCIEFIKEIKGLPYKEAHQMLNQKVRALNENIPPLFNSYMNLSPSMKTFGTAINDHFGAVEETGIMVTIPDIYENKKDRHIQSYIDWKNLQSIQE
jgi:hypothetical protein